MRNHYSYEDEQEKFEKELSVIRDELTELRNSAIKSEHQLRALTADLRAFNEHLEGASRKKFLSSGIAYLLFTILLCAGAGLYLYAREQGQASRSALWASKEQAYQTEVAELRAAVGRWKQTEHQLLEFEALVKSGEKERAVESFQKLSNVRFSSLLEDLVSRFRREVAREKFELGADAYRKGSFDRADTFFAKSLSLVPEPPYQGSLLHLHGMSRLRMRSFAPAARLLRQALDYQHSPKVLAELRYHLAYTHDRLGEKRTARDLYWRFSQRHPKHPFAGRAKRRYESLKKTKSR